MSQRILFMALLASALLVSGCERAKTKLDREVDRLCAIDGGVRVFETVKLSRENFGPNGEVFPQYRSLPLSSGRYGPDYYFSVDEQLLIEGNPSLRKSVSVIVRRSDGKVLGSRTNFSRRGGDALGPWPDSSKSCMDVLPADSGLESSVFIQQGESK